MPNQAGPMRRVLLLLLLAALLVSSACAKKFEVLQTFDLDQLPAIARLSSEQPGYDLNDTLLVLVPVQLGRARIGRDKAVVLAIKKGDGDWQAPGPNQLKELDPISFVYPDDVELKNDHVRLPRELGRRENVPGPRDLVWFRVALKGAIFSIEAAFNTTPLTIRKVSYRALENGAVVLIQSAATLKVR
jgi:hypothetical protein